MVKYEELIYEFADIYLKTAVEASICKENYELANDDTFLEEYMRLFVTLIQAVENDSTITVDEIREKLNKSKQEVLDDFDSFLENKIVEQAVERVTNEKNASISENGEVFCERIRAYHKSFFDDEFKKRMNSPSSSLEYVRSIEERV